MNKYKIVQMRQRDKTITSQRSKKKRQAPTKNTMKISAQRRCHKATKPTNKQSEYK